MNPRVNRWLDLLDRVGWTALQAAGAALLTYLSTGQSFGWEEAGVFVGYAALLAALKVLVGQSTGTDDTGALIGKPVIEPPPESGPTQ